MVVRNEIPSEAIILETVVAIIISTVAVVIYQRYRKRPRISLLYLFLTLIGYALAVWSSNIGKIIDFNSSTTQDVVSYSGFTINIAYCFVAFANIFLYSLIENVFFSNVRERKFVAAGIFSILLGIILDGSSLDESTYSNLFNFILIFIFFSLALYILLFTVSIKEIKKNEGKKIKLGFTFIALFGLFLMLMFVFFAIDIYRISITDNGYNLEYYLGWISGAIASLFAYMGFTMPDWVVKLFGVEN